MKQKIIFFLKAFVSIALFTIILTKTDWEITFKLIRNANILLIVLVVVIALFIRWLMAYKWNVLLRVNQSEISIFNLLKIIMIGSFLGLFLPSSLSTDVVRGYYLNKENSNKLHITSTIVIDRLLGLLSLLLMGIVGVYFSNNLLSNLKLEPILFIGTAGIILVFIILFSKNISAKLITKFLNRDNKLNNIIKKGYRALTEFYNYPASLIYSFVSSLSIQVLRIIRFYIIALAININISIIPFIIIVPIIMIVIMIPISIGGLGVKEGAAISLLVLLGVPHNDAIVLTLIESFTTTFVTLLGGLFYLGYKK